MGFSSQLYENEPIFDDSTPESAVMQPAGTGRGLLLPMSHSAHGGNYSFASAFPSELLVPKGEWEARIKEKEEKKDRISDLCMAAGLPCKDQGNTNYCFPPGTRVRMANGSSKRIEDVRLLDLVLSAEGNVRAVGQLHVRDYDGELCELGLYGHSNVLHMTPNHSVLTKRGYVRADELRPGYDCVALPRFSPCTTRVVQTAGRVMSVRKTVNSVGYSVDPSYNEVPDFLELTPGLGRLLGLYLAEGHTDKNGYAWFSFHIDETETLASDVHCLLASEFGIEARVVFKPETKVVQVRVCGKLWAQLFRSLCGHLATGKRVDSELMSGPKEFLEALLYGWLDGDGCVKGRNRERLVGCTVSHELALDMFDVANALGLCPSIFKSKRARQGAWTKQYFYLVSFLRHENRHHSVGLEEGRMWRKVKTVRRSSYVGKVYNIGVEVDNTYVAESIGVHNCWINAPVHCVEIVRLLQNQQVVILSPASCGSKIKNFSNSGGWGEEGLRYIVDYGVVPVSMWPANAINRQYDTSAAWLEADKYRVTEWIELRPRSLEEQVSCYLRNIPTADGQNHWSHEITGCDAVWLDGEVALRKRNSWGMGYGFQGFFVQRGSKMLADDCVAPLVAMGG